MTPLENLIDCPTPSCDEKARLTPMEGAMLYVCWWCRGVWDKHVTPLGGERT